MSSPTSISLMVGAFEENNVEKFNDEVNKMLSAHKRFVFKKESYRLYTCELNCVDNRAILDIFMSIAWESALIVIFTEFGTMIFAASEGVIMHPN